MYPVHMLPRHEEGKEMAHRWIVQRWCPCRGEWSTVEVTRDLGRALAVHRLFAASGSPGRRTRVMAYSSALPKCLVACAVMCLASVAVCAALPALLCLDDVHAAMFLSWACMFAVECLVCIDRVCEWDEAVRS